MNLENHAKNEFLASGWVDEEGNYKCEHQKCLCKNALELLEVFSKQHHSGTTAPYVVSMFNELARFRPLVPLTGEDFEWVEVSDGLWQNKRCSHVFKGADGKAYDIHGKVFRDPDGCCYTNKDSQVYVEFPYTPKSETIDRK